MKVSIQGELFVVDNPKRLQNISPDDSRALSADGQISHTLSEIYTQPVAWQAALEEVKTRQAALHNVWRENQFSEILVTGCGSTYYLSLAVAPLLQQQLGKRARAVPASELLFFPETVLS